ncbi:hypothetical protein OG883_31125 [Streptomyces sp. NBC_01142]|uniref:hypothetical protein n=1 Tax=Streptomyces sp. NBC_01142 TaxID=2975865 RepID=UPI002258DF2A|nr:hypothetical protein [Streptomyces sp. NBC_01142]MCX4824232.1 hypothetical protein [Streptomyces sp. NBC_01142]
MTAANPTERKKPTAPKAGDRPTVRVTDAFADDLAVIMSTMGTDGTFADAVRQAVGQLAGIYRTAWAHGIVPRGTAPTLGAYQFVEQLPGRRPTSGYDGRSDTSAGRPTPHVGRMLAGRPPGPHIRHQFAEELLGRPTEVTPPARPDAERPART